MDNQGKICANVVVDGNSMGYLGTFLGNSTFGNKDYTLDFIKNLTGTTIPAWPRCQPDPNEHT